MLLLKAQAPTAPAPKTAEQQFKNIQVLKGVPADQVIPTMQFISASLGVECEFCHVEHAFDKDDKKEKLTARQMIEMQRAINTNNFKGEMEVTCNSCHRGATRPMAIPAVADGTPKPEAAPAGLPPQNADALIARYIQALGGADALKKITSITEKGSANVNGRQMPIDIYAQAPNRRVSFLHVPNGDSVTAFNGTAGWLASPGRPIHDMTASEANGARLEAEFTFPANLQQEFTRLRVLHPDKIDDKPVTQVVGMREGQPPVRLYFDDQSGLLVRTVRYAETALGRMPTQVDYADFRDVNGVKMPHQWTISRPNGRFTIQVSEIQQNQPIDESKFVRPPDPPAPPAATK